jgi:UDP-sugar transporter A1/2/3
VIVVICQSVGGLVTAVVVKYTNTIIKGFAVGLSVVFTSILSVALFNSTLTLIFCMGALAVLLSIFNFNEEDLAGNMPSAEAKKNAPVPGTPFAPEEAQLLRARDEEEEMELAARPSSGGNGRPGIALNSARDTAL